MTIKTFFSILVFLLFSTTAYAVNVVIKDGKTTADFNGNGKVIINGKQYREESIIECKKIDFSQSELHSYNKYPNAYTKLKKGLYALYKNGELIGIKSPEEVKNINECQGK